MQGRMRVSRVGRRELRGLRRSGGDRERTDGLFGRGMTERERVQGRRWRRAGQDPGIMPQRDVASVCFVGCIAAAAAAAAAKEQRLQSIRPLLRSRPTLLRLPPLRLDEQVVAVVVVFFRLSSRTLCPFAVRRQVVRRVVLFRRRPGLELTTAREVLVVVVASGIVGRDVSRSRQRRIRVRVPRGDVLGLVAVDPELEVPVGHNGTGNFASESFTFGRRLRERGGESASSFTHEMNGVTM